MPGGASKPGTLHAALDHRSPQELGERPPALLPATSRFGLSDSPEEHVPEGRSLETVSATRTRARRDASRRLGNAPPVFTLPGPGT